jgi:hypothetical protein
MGRLLQVDCARQRPTFVCSSSAPPPHPPSSPASSGKFGKFALEIQPPPPPPPPPSLLQAMRARPLTSSAINTVLTFAARHKSAAALSLLLFRRRLMPPPPSPAVPLPPRQILRRLLVRPQLFLHQRRCGILFRPSAAPPPSLPSPVTRLPQGVPFHPSLPRRQHARHKRALAARGAAARAAFRCLGAVVLLACLANCYLVCRCITTS